MNLIKFAALLLIGLCAGGSPIALAENTSSQLSQLSAAGSSADTIMDLIRCRPDTDIEQTKLRPQYVPIFRKVLPGKKAATFFQLDRHIGTMIDLQLTSQLPLAQDQD